MNKINIFPQALPVRPKHNHAPKATANKGDFAAVLNNHVEVQKGVKLSAHAQKRLVERNITLDAADMTKINSAMEKAAAKGAKDSLLIYGDLALIANIKNNTLVTAIDGQNLQEHVFTKIDSAVFVK